jgi:uncharacterized membrane protein
MPNPPAEQAHSIICPACGGANPPEQVFCANPECNKALGDFKYVLEELRAEARWHEALAEKVTGFIGKPQFLGIHILWFALWILINSGVVIVAWRFDQYPYSLLGIIVAMETIFITAFVLISQNRQNAHSDKRAELDYEVSVRIYRKVNELESSINTLLDRLERLEKSLPSEPSER